MNFYPPGRRRYSRAASIVLLSLLFVVGASKLVTTHAAATFTVNSLGDTADAAPGNGTCADANGACTFRAAIAEANALSGDDTINFSVTGTINLTGPLPALITNISINGPGSSQLTVRRDTGGDYRIFQTSGSSSISGLTITNGRTPDSIGNATAAPGGGIWQTGGSLTLRDVVVTANATGNGGTNATSGSSFGGWGGFGGGINATGTLTMTDCVVSNNTTGNGGTGGGFGGSGGRGAGIYFLIGTLTLTNVTITGNHTGNSGGPTAGNSGYGGGMWIGSDAVQSGPATNVNMSHVTITNNSTGNNITTGDAGGGGGLYVADSTVTVTDSTISNNHTGSANLSSFAGTAGSGGGIFNVGALTIRNSLITGNTTGDSTPGANSTGGGISNHFSAVLINTTVSGNSTGAGPSMGGGIFSSIAVIMYNCTVTGNTTPNGFGNGVTGNGGNIIVGNTIIARNGPGGNGPDLANSLFTPPDYNSQGYNLVGNADGACCFNFVGDQAGTGAAPINPQLGPLADNGGPTLTHALLPGSPALDAGNNALAKDPNNPLTTDQRGSARIVDSPDAGTTATVDLGAFEFQPNFESIPDKTTFEDTPINVSFNTGDGGPAISSLTATSTNEVVVPNSNLVFSGGGSFRTLQITPAANLSGLTTINLTINLSGGGTINDEFLLTVNPVNDAPTFTKGADQAVDEDSGPQTVINWATAINAGPNEGAQTLSFDVTNNTNASLFSAGPAVSQSGTLTYTPAANAFGSATITIVLKDDGGTANGGQDTSVAQTFTINVAGINDAPTFTKGADQTTSEDAGFQAVFNWSTGISAGPNESGQSVTFIVTNNTNPALFQIAPAVSSFGTLTYMPAVNASGTADITIVAKDNAGTANGGVDTSDPQTFTITVIAVNDAPADNIPFFPQTNQQTTLVFSAANSNAISISDVDAANDPIRVSLTASDGTLTLGSTTGLGFVNGDGVDDVTMAFTGTIAAINSALNGLSFKPNNGFSGTATIQIVSDDQGHNGAGGAKTTTSTIQVIVRSGGRFSFNTANYGVNENGGTATITVLRAGGSAGTATVNYATSNGTATGGTSCTTGVDYLSTSGAFTWNNGDTSVRQFTVVICNDGSNEEDETITLSLSNAGGTGSLGIQQTATLTVGNDDAPVLLTEEGTTTAIALDLVTQTRGPFSLINPFSLDTDQRRRVSLLVWHLGLLASDTPSSVIVTATDSEGRIYDLPVEFLSPVLTVDGVTQVIVRLPDNVIGAPRDLRVKVTLRGPGSNEAFISIAGP